MQIKIYLFSFLLYNFIIQARFLDVNDDSDEIELFRRLFAKLNKILEGNDSVQNDLGVIKSRLEQIKDQSAFKDQEDLLSCSGNRLPLNINTAATDNYYFGDNWTIIQRRRDGSENFNRDWKDYKQGFGNKSNEFFVGLEELHRLTAAKPHELLVVMQDFDNAKRYAQYDTFEIGSEEQKYVLKNLGMYTGNVGDSLSYHKGSKFSTKDQDNDQHANFNCAEKFQSAWWFKACHESNLNGCYSDTNLRNPKTALACGIHWQTFRGRWYSLKFVEIMIRPKV